MVEILRPAKKNARLRMTVANSKRDSSPKTPPGMISIWIIPKNGDGEFEGSFAVNHAPQDDNALKFAANANPFVQVSAGTRRGGW